MEEKDDMLIDCAHFLLISSQELLSNLIERVVRAPPSSNTFLELLLREPKQAAASLRAIAEHIATDYVL